MTDNKNTPFKPNNAWDSESDNGFGGLTKREYFAGLALQGLLANRWSMENGSYQSEDIVKQAISNADELLKQLEK